MSGRETAEVVVVGAGAMGCSIAFHLARAGVRSVTVLDKGGICSGMTYRSGALVRLHYTNEHEARIALCAYRYFHEWREIVGGDCGFVQTGFLMVVGPDDVDRLHANIAMLRSLGVETEAVTPDDIREAQPFARVDDIGAAAYEPLSGYADPHKTTIAFAEAARGLGVRFHTGRAVTGLRTRSGRITGVETEHGPIDAGAVVVAAGPWAAGLLRTAGVEFPIQPTLAEIAMFRRPAPVTEGHMVYIDRVSGTYFRPQSPRLTFVGAGHGSVRLADPDNLADGVSEAQSMLARERIANRIPAFAGAEPAMGHQGAYDMSPDGKAILDRAPGVDGLYIAGGFSGTGFKKSPAIGLLMSELITEGAAHTVDIRPFRFSRFAEGEEIHGPHEYGWVESAQLRL
ncbi:MAG: NAD(P)/FAD-dependent oxidoreductase [Dehalococcoidia bacterium]